MTLMIFSPATSPSEPPKIVKSCEYTATWRPWIVPMPVTTASPYGRDLLHAERVGAVAHELVELDEADPWSSSCSMRSRAVILPLACCFSMRGLAASTVTASW